jgi:guanylate kinase
MDEAVPELLKQKIRSYKMPSVVETLVRETRLLLVAGTAGSGKNAVINELTKGKGYRYIVSHTTREPRSGEKNGESYYFVDESTIMEMIDSQRFVEVKLVHEKSVYGTSIEELQKVHDQGLIGVTDIDVQGVQEYVHVNPDTRAVFLLPPSHDEWMRRLAARGEQDQDELQRRLASAETELEHALESGHFHFVINTDLDKAVEDIRRFAENHETAGDDDVRVEHAWHVLGELKQELSS